MTYTQALNKMKTHKPGTPEHSEAWQAAESAKNQNGGMPPKVNREDVDWVLANYGFCIPAGTAMTGEEMSARILEVFGDHNQRNKLAAQYAREAGGTWSAEHATGYQWGGQQQ